jgi:hypothetical protein
MSCPVCFGGDDPVVRESLNAGIGVLMGVTTIVLGCFARFFVVLARRARFAGEVDFGFEPTRATATALSDAGAASSAMPAPGAR